MITENVTNAMGMRNSLLVSRMGTITGDFLPGFNFLIKNVSGDILEDVEIIPANNDNSITTTLSEGWNPELCKAVLNAPEGLQYGL